MPYKFLEGLTVADVAFEATGKTLKELFESAANATTETMVKSISSVQQKIKKKFEVEAENVEMLLYKFLQEIIFYKDAEMLLFSKYELDFVPKNKVCKLVVTAFGEKVGMAKHEQIVDVKAVTFHHYKVEETKDGWRAQVILDI